MRKLSILFCMAFLSVAATAQSPTRSQVGTAARVYMQVMTGKAPGLVKYVYKNAIENATGTSIQASSKMNVLQYAQGGWILMSNDYRVQPVLAYSPTGVWESDTSLMPPALVELLVDYINQIDTVKNFPAAKSAEETEFYQANKTKWTGLQSDTSSYARALTQRKGQHYVEPLLVDEYGNELLWSQGYPYDKFAPEKDEFVLGCIGARKECDGDHKPIGCSSVAMGMVMKYWNFPPQYDWEMMPFSVTQYNSIKSINNVALLLKTCGDKAGVTYCCPGSWTTMNKIEDAMKDMHFSKTDKVTRRDNDKGSWWTDKIKGQLDKGQPVIYRGDQCDLCPSKHFWVMDGYNGNGEFHCNWGWGYGWNGYFSIKKLKLSGVNYKKNNMMLFDIIPDWNVTNSCTYKDIEKGDDEEFREFCGTAYLSNITLTGNSQSKVAFTQQLTIDGPFEVSGRATLTLACYDKELAAQQQNSAKKGTQTETDDDEEGDGFDFSLIEEERLSAAADFFVLSPNPAKHEVQVSMATYMSGDERKEVNVFDSQGRCRYITQFTGSYCVLPLDGLHQGMYLVRVSCNGQGVTKKLMVR